MKKLQSLPVRAALLLCVVFAGNIKAQLTTTRNGNYASMTYLVNNVLLGNSGITATNITYQGIDSSFGFFNGSASNIGMDTGIIMCNGGINIAAGPNQKTYGDVKDGKWTTFDQSTTDGWANAAKYQDADLAALAKTNIANTFSCAILQFDFTASSDTIQFEYSFGSNEWPYYVPPKYNFNDDFGFFLSGPGIAGPYTNGAINLATLPTVNTAVSIDAVNCKTNPIDYVCNYPNSNGCTTCPANPLPSTTTVGYNGFTIVLTAKAKIQCGKTYHIKLGVADIGDAQFDSGVFLKGGSFKPGSGTMTVTASTTSATCPGAPVTLIAANATTYKWSPATALSATTGDTVIATPSVTTTYTVIGNAGGCGDSTTFVVKVDTLTPPVLSFKDSICSGSSTTITAIGTGLTYLWNTGATTSSITLSGLTSTTTDTLKATNACGQDTVMPFTVHIVSPSVVTITASYDTVCLGSSTTLTASGGTTYSWSTGATGSSIVVTPTKDSVLVVTTTNSCPGTAKDTITVIPPFITLTITGPTAVCPGASATLTASGGTTYLWAPSSSLSSSTGTSVNASPSVTTTYNINSKVGTCNASANYTLSVATIQLPVITFKDSICSGGTTTITATGNKLTYAWSTGATTSSFTTTPLINDTTYTLTVTDTCGTTATDPVTVHVIQPAIPRVVATPDTICPGSSTTIIANGGSGYTWSPATGLNTTTGSSVVASTTVQTIYTVTTTNVCSGVSTDTIYIYPPLTPSISGPTSVCPGGSAVLTASGGTTYTWQPGGLTGSTVSVSPGISTTYTVTANTGTCSGMITYTVTVSTPATLSVVASPDTICPNTPTVLSVNGGSTYTWNTGATGASITVSPSTTTVYTVTSVGSGGCISNATITVHAITVVQPVISGSNITCQNDTVTLTASGGNGTAYDWSTGQHGSSISFVPNTTGAYEVWNIGGCADTSAPYIVTVNTVSPLTTYGDTTIIIGGSAPIGASGATSYQWLPTGTVGCVSCATTIVTPDVSTTYTVIGTESNGCKVTGTVIVLIECQDFTVPNVFTPNGDGQNDLFLIKSENEPNYSIEIYDRWGVLMYKTNNPSAPWNGKIDNTGAEVPDGVYYYIIISKCGNNDYNHHGYVEVIRK